MLFTQKSGLCPYVGIDQVILFIIRISLLREKISVNQSTVTSSIVAILLFMQYPFYCNNDSTQNVADMIRWQQTG